MRYNGLPLHIPACQAEGAHLPGSKGEVCTLAAFTGAVSKVQMTAKEWEEGCAVVVGPGDVQR